ncbi:MAG: threonine synthase [Alphaproteobacteria bacterium]|jgi:threonine synthase
MKYISSRGQAPILNFDDVLMAGLGSDGGLYVPETYPQLSRADICSAALEPYTHTAFKIMYPFVKECIPEADFIALIETAYGRFHHQGVVPLTQLNQGSYLLELFHGPTLAFKDVALQLLGQLFNYTLNKRGEKITIIGATSGDTGSAAIEGLRGLDNVDVYILFPKDRPSDVQRRQMSTINEDNIHAIAVNGTFDDCQAMVKTLFADSEFRKKTPLGAVNSINWARVMAQIVYYVTSAASVGCPNNGVSFSVPTGNFGDILAGYIAGKMGLPIHKLYIASNENDILSRCYHSGIYKKSDVATTYSPSMDIQISSNFERLLFDFSGRNPDIINQMMHDLKKNGAFTLNPTIFAQFQGLFGAGKCDNAQTLKTIEDVYKKTGHLIDPHSAVGIYVGEQCHDKSTPLINLACAAAAKFPEIVKKATGQHPELPDFLSDLHDRTEHIQEIDNDIEAFKAIIS